MAPFCWRNQLQWQQSFGGCSKVCISQCLGTEVSDHTLIGNTFLSFSSFYAGPWTCLIFLVRPIWKKRPLIFSHPIHRRWFWPQMKVCLVQYLIMPKTAKAVFQVHLTELSRRMPLAMFLEVSFGVDLKWLFGTFRNWLFGWCSNPILTLASKVRAVVH